MKHPIAIVILLALATTVYAQSSKDHIPKFYTQIGIGPSTHNGSFTEFGGTVVFKNKWTTSITYQDFDMTPSNLPSDYKRGYTFIFPDEWPSMKMKSINFTAGKYFPLNRQIWFTAEAGVAITSGDSFIFTRQAVVETTWQFSSNYAIHSEPPSTGAGAIIKADFNWAICPYVGFSGGVFANVNSLQSMVGLDFKIIVGWLNSKKIK